jgi:prepilin-type N-terminal cleavage/methylation domain-containing protein
MKNKGFTLVEVMVAVFLSTVVCAGIYGVWTEVTRRVALATTKQSLQNELRTASSHMQKDFKSIKADSLNIISQNDDGSAFKIEFECFTEEEDDKFAQDSVTKVGYELVSGILTRSGDTGGKILSSHVESMSIGRAVDEDNLDATALEATDEDFRAGREAQLDISITGKMVARGLGQEVYHVEKTSIVMRDEYHKKTNKTYVANYDLTKEDYDELVVLDESLDGMLFPGNLLSEEFLMSLDKEQLEGMSQAQKDLLAQTQSSLNDMNETIDATNTGESWATKAWDWVKFLSDSEGELVRGWRSELSGANTVEATKAAMDKLKTFTKTKDEEFKTKSIPGYAGMSKAQKELYAEAYALKLQDRTLEGAYNLMKKQAEKDKTTAPDKPATNYDSLTNYDAKTEYVDGDGVLRSESMDEETKERNRKLAAAYDSISLNWMGEFNKETDEVKVYNSAQSLLTQGESKVAMMEMRDISQKNLDLIDKVKDTK